MTDAEICREIRSDCERDANKLTGAPFNGRTVAEALGNILAMVATLADVVGRQVEKTEIRP